MSVTIPILRVGLAGLGTVGASVYRRLASQKDLLVQRIGTEIRVDQVADRRVEVGDRAGDQGAHADHGPAADGQIVADHAAFFSQMHA